MIVPPGDDDCVTDCASRAVAYGYRHLLVDEGIGRVFRRLRRTAAALELRIEPLKGRVSDRTRVTMERLLQDVMRGVTFDGRRTLLSPPC